MTAVTYPHVTVGQAPPTPVSVSTPGRCSPLTPFVIVHGARTMQRHHAPYVANMSTGAF